ncbi:hypothetical protein F5X97DRAFT_310966 [Nemania serpens]|nr:hypothetical protein F5X97DRAFT_310966 [Nemania serpens]
MSRRRILGILLDICPKNLRYFEYFVREGITDDHLPLTPIDFIHSQAVRTRLGTENTTLFKDWERPDVTRFYCYQPKFCAPFLDFQEQRLCHYSLDRSIRLPWLEYESRVVRRNGIPLWVEIHPSHHNFRPHQVRISRPEVLYYVFP